MLIPSSAFASWFTCFFHVTSALKSGAKLCFSLGLNHVWDDFTSFPWVPGGHRPGLRRSAPFMDHPLKIVLDKLQLHWVSHLCVLLLIWRRRRQPTPGLLPGCRHSILRRSFQSLLEETQASKVKGGRQEHWQRGTYLQWGLLHCHLSHSLNLSIMGINYHGERSTPRHIMVVDFEKVAADFKENKVC